MDLENTNFFMKPSPSDSRDWIYDEVHNLPYDKEYLAGAPTPVSLPAVLDYRGDLLPPRTQGRENSCYAFASCACKEWQEKKNCCFNGYFSPQFIYDNRPNNTTDSGMYARDVMTLLQNLGVCSETDFPYSGNGLESKSLISQTCYANALNFKIANYAAVTSMDGLKRALFDNGPCLIAFPIFNYGQYPWIQGPNDKPIGGHTLNVCGYDNNGFIIRNSWGPSWNGTGYTTYNYSDWGKHWEAYTICDDLSSINVYNPAKPINQIAVQNTSVVLTTALTGQFQSGNQTAYQIDVDVKNNGTSPASNLKFNVDCDILQQAWSVTPTNDQKTFTLPSWMNNSIPPGQSLRWGLIAVGKKPIVNIV